MRTAFCPYLLALMAAALLAPLAGAQEEETPTPEAKPQPKTALEATEDEKQESVGARELFSAALHKLRRQRDVVVRAAIEHKQPEAEAKNVNGPNGQQIRVIMNARMFGNNAEPFEGAVEAWRDADGATVIVSEKDLPGFGLYMKGERTVRRLTYEDDAPGLKQLKSELTSLLDGERMVKYLLEAKLGHLVDPATGDHVWSGTISKDLLPPVTNTVNKGGMRIMMGNMTPTVLRANVEMRLTKDGELKSTTIKVVRNNPAASMMGGGMVQIVVQGGAGGAPGWLQPQGGKDKKEQVEGKTTVYSLDFTKTQPSERATAFKREILRSLQATEK